MKRLALFLLLALPARALAQEQARPAGSTGVEALRAVWESVSGYVLRSAEEMPEAEYAFRPVGTVRTFGQQIAHVAGAQYTMCAAALGEPPKDEDEIERTMTTKAQLVAALRASSEYCRRAYSQSDADAARSITLYGESRTRMFALALNATHDGEHYGNLITYLRIKGRVPPSSQRTQ
ncbi:MAG TPA: DinB family protein [Gemmatimonadaceae bacterium]|nr:DinB family protein [Gemmatimonadaceae bacterium]